MLGFLLAGLLALLFMPVLSRRAVRLASRRLSMLVPLSMAEVAAERDGIRAEHAAAVRRLEQRIDLLTRDKADAMAEAGREAARAASIDAARTTIETRATVLQGERDAATRAAHEAEAQFGLQEQGLHDALGLADRRLATLNAAQAHLAASEARSDERRLTIAGLETRATGQDLRLRALTGQVATLTRDVQEVRTALDAVTREREVARADAALLSARLALAQAGIEAADAEAAALRARLAEREAGTDDLAALRKMVVTLAADIHRAAQERSATPPDPA